MPLKTQHAVTQHLKPIGANRSLDDALRDFFGGYLGYAAVQYDPLDPNPARLEAWRLVVPEVNSAPFAVAYEKDLSRKSRKQVARLFTRTVQDRLQRAASPQPPALYVFTDGARYVFFSADPFRNRDDKFDLSAQTLSYAGNVNKLEELRRRNLQFRERLGLKRPLVDFLFRATPLSQDERFKKYVHQIREELLHAALEDDTALALVVARLLNPDDVTKAGKLKRTRHELYVEYGQGLGDALAGAVDTLLLRLILMRFVEAYYGELAGLRRVRDVLHDGGVENTTLHIGGPLLKNVDGLDETQRQLAQVIDRALNPDVSKAKKSKHPEYRQLDLFIGKPQLADELEAEENARKTRLGGDFYLGELAEAATALEKRFLQKPKSRGARALTEFLGRTAEDANWEFRYEDLRPQTLQDYYEEALGTAVQITYNKADDALKVEVTKSKRQQKERGAYYTNAQLCRFMVEKTVKPLFEARREELGAAIKSKDAARAQYAVRQIVGMRICDPTMGSAPFLRSAFDFLSEQYSALVETLAPAREALPEVWAQWRREFPFLTDYTLPDEQGAGKWEWHILRRMLYGVDIDRKAVCIASQTFALSSLRYLPEGERFPSFFNVNLKLGNALVNPVRTTEYEALSKKHHDAIGEAVRLRHLAATTSNYQELNDALARVEQVIGPITDALIEERLEPIVGEYTTELAPFCWELEFPEIFFDEQGRPREDAGFDVMIGNPPWDQIRVDIKDGAKAHGFDSVEAYEKAMKSSALLKQGWQDYVGLKEAWKEIAGSDLFAYQTGGRDHNYWRMAIEVVHRLATSRAHNALVIPSGIIADDNGRAVRRLILSSSKLQPVLSFRKENEIFPEQHQAFSVLIWYKGEATDEIRHTDGLVSANELHYDHATIPVPFELVEKMAPLTWAIPSIAIEMDLDILRRLYQFDVLQAWQDKGIIRAASGDYHMGHDRHLFRRNGKGIALQQGDTIDKYEMRSDAIEYWVDKPKPRNNTRSDMYRIVWRDIAGMEDPYKLVTTVLPPNATMGDTVNVLNLEGFDSELCCYLSGVLNSVCLDWRVRQIAKNVHVKIVSLLQLPIPPFEGGATLAIARCAAQLLYTDERFAALAEPLNVTGVREPRARQRLKNEIDARVALLYGLTAEELQYILTKFPKVDEDIKAGVMEEYRRLESGD